MGTGESRRGDILDVSDADQADSRREPEFDERDCGLDLGERGVVLPGHCTRERQERGLIHASNLGVCPKRKGPEDGRQTLNKQAAWLKQYANYQITIEGHCDERGTREYNLALGERRAAAIRAFLVGQGIPANRMRTISYGKERPEVLGSDETSYARNRRGVTVLSN